MNKNYDFWTLMLFTIQVHKYLYTCKGYAIFYEEYMYKN